MQLQLSFMETAAPAEVSPVWTALDPDRRTEIVAALARLITRAAEAVAATQGQAAGDEEGEND